MHLSFVQGTWRGKLWNVNALLFAALLYCSESAGYGRDLAVQLLERHWNLVDSELYASLKIYPVTWCKNSLCLPKWDLNLHWCFFVRLLLDFIIWYYTCKDIQNFLSWEYKGSFWQFLAFYMLLIFIFNLSTDDHFIFNLSTDEHLKLIKWSKLFFLLSTHFYFLYSTISR